MKDELPSATLLHRFLHWEAVKADSIFLTQPVGDDVFDYTWAAAGRDARRLAARLLALGLPRGSRVALVGKNTAYWVIADVAIMMAGLVSVPIYPTMSGATARYVLEHSEAKLLIVGKLGDGGDNWQEIKAALPDGLTVLALPMAPLVDGLQWESVVGREPLSDVRVPEPGDICTIAYTSGSTGRPKGVVHSYASMLAIQPAIALRNRIEPTDRLLSYLPLAHVAERLMEGMAIYNGLHIFFVESLSTFGRDVARARPTTFFSVPRLWVKFKQGVDASISPALQRWLFAMPGVSAIVKRRILRRLGLDQVRVATSGSAPIAPEVIRWYRVLGLELLEGYGMSENFGMSHYTEVGRVVPGQVGTPMEGVEARFGTNGELLVRSPGQMVGYHRDPELTAACLTEDGFFRTGDLGTIDELGALTITGRTKDLFKTAKGKYVAPVPIENAIVLPGIDAVCVVGADRTSPFALLLPSAELRFELFDEAAREAKLQTIASILSTLNSSLEPHERLSHAVIVHDEWTSSNGLLTPTLKVVRSAVENRYLCSAARDTGHLVLL